MYFPYFRGKQFELVALRDMSELIRDNGKIIPIIEPVKKNTNSLEATVKDFIEKNISLILISNPQVGDYKNNSQQLRSKFLEKYKSSRNVIIGYVIHSRSSDNDIRSFVEEYGSNSIALIHYHSFADFDGFNKILRQFDNDIYHIFIDGHTGRGYQKIVAAESKGKKIIICDGLNAQEKNSEYPENEFFSDNHQTYIASNFTDFGDFLMVGEQYKETGGPAYAVVIHLTYLHKTEDIWIRHFVSDRTDTPVDPAGKFLEALTKFYHCFQNDTQVYQSEAFNKFMILFKESRYPGLGYVKKLSMEHHIELMANRILTQPD